MFQVRANPFRFLLYTEWALLAIVALAEILSRLLLSRPRNLPLVPSLLILVLFGLMGLVLPSGRWLYKVLYTATEFGLILCGGSLAQLRLLPILPILYLIVVIRSCFIFELPGRRAIAGFSFVTFLMNQMQYTHRLQMREPERFWLYLLTNALVFGVQLLFVLQLVNIVLAERKTREQLSIANQKLQQYTEQVKDLATWQERNRIARDIHDSLGHSLTAMNIQLQGAMKLWEVEPEQAKLFLAEAKRLGELSMWEVRHSVRTLRTDTPQEQSLEAAIQSVVKDFYNAHGLLPSINFNFSANLPGEVINAIYRIVQEALTNISKYAEATKVDISISSTASRVCLTIKDNGRGFNLEQNSAGFGIQGMRERVAAFLGRFTIETSPGNGCKIHIEIPLQRLTA